MTHQEAQTLVKKLIQARDKEELQTLISRHVSQCDGVFFESWADIASDFQPAGGGGITPSGTVWKRNLGHEESSCALGSKLYAKVNR